MLLEGSEGKNIEVKAKREVIVCGGSFGSPAILLRSGIGPKEELQAVGVESVVDLKGVGKNLMDHPVSIASLFNLFALNQNSRVAERTWFPTGRVTTNVLI